MSNPDYTLDENGDRLITDDLLAKLFAPIIQKLKSDAAEVGEDFFNRNEWLAIIKDDIAKLPNRLPAEMEGGTR